MNKQRLGSIALLITAAIWGFAFVAQSRGMEHLGPLTFSCARFFLGMISLLPVIYLKDRGRSAMTAAEKKQLAKGGMLCGLCLAGGTVFQQAGLLYTGTGKAGFLTAIYLILVPILGVFKKKPAPPRVWICALIAMAGMYLLCMDGDSALNKGDVLVMICAIFFALHIMVIDRYTAVTDSIKLSCLQFFTAGVISIAGMLIFEKPTLPALMDARLPLLYTGIMSSGVAYTLQIAAQKHTPPAAATVIMSLESVFAAVGGWLLLGQELTARELVGCGILFAAVVLVQLPAWSKKQR